MLVGLLAGFGFVLYFVILFCFTFIFQNRKDIEHLEDRDPKSDPSGGEFIFCRIPSVPKAFFHYFWDRSK